MTNSGNFRVASRKQKHMGYHFCNSVSSIEKANIIIWSDLFIETNRAIRKGEKLLLDYNKTGDKEGFHPHVAAGKEK